VYLTSGWSPRTPEHPGCGRDDPYADHQRYGNTPAHTERVDACQRQLHPAGYRTVEDRCSTEYGSVSVVELAMDTETLLQHRKNKDEFFKLSPQSPIPAHERETFGGLTYFDPNPDLVFTIKPEPVEPTPVRIETTTGDARTYHRVATVTVPIEHKHTTLALYSTGNDSLFLPFRDATSGKESYGAGRYLDIEPNEDGSITIDFNLAYAPFCAYSEQYSCALPPQENWTAVSVEAGERNPS